MTKEAPKFTKGERVLIQVLTQQSLIADDWGINHWSGYAELEEARVISPVVKPKSFFDHVKKLLWGSQVEIQLTGSQNPTVVFERDLEEFPV